MHSLLFLLFFGFFGVFFSIIVLIPFWFIFKKAGFSPFLALLMLLPFVSSCNRGVSGAPSALSAAGMI